MSISADDTGDHDLLAAAVHDWNAGSANSDVPAAFITALRTGTPGVRYQVTHDEHAVHVAVARAGAPPYNPDRERAIWQQLRVAMRDATLDGIQPELPCEFTMAVRQHDGREILLCRPGTALDLRRARERLRRRLTALSPLPLLGTLLQPVAGSATAVGIAIAPIPPIPPHSPPPAPPVVREMNGEIARPPLPWLGASHPEHGILTPPTPPALPEPKDTPAVDTVSPPAVTPTRRTAPRQPAGPKPAREPARAPAPSTTPPAMSTPTPAPTGQDEPVTSIVPDQPPPAPEASPTAAPNPHAHRHGKHHKPRPLRGRGRH
ncbi:hypothetical protein [Actinomadura decatromicini]|uniref:Uncharacterized protein n=1 Tax=Actinomadura decatromicini TaxID=2604572 RepID=A0A5D3FBV5_9ACTN|nr:hypothetical protein [Actinomadura decatromicini]TYK45230.1 hypothetical protein FXF68_31630 [Actinomadura decatromicini]